jgi:hypothetical protein
MNEVESVEEGLKNYSMKTLKSVTMELKKLLSTYLGYSKIIGKNLEWLPEEERDFREFLAIPCGAFEGLVYSALLMYAIQSNPNPIIPFVLVPSTAFFRLIHARYEKRKTKHKYLNEIYKECRV